MKRLIVALLIISAPARAADYALVINDAEKAALIEALDEATKAKGLAIANKTVFLLNKIQTAPMVTDRKEDPPKETPK